ncbi:hypothetical protein ACIQ6K_26545 [Streptomyces sp. NPDC096354]|uniref:hypothetical protein n=1 Tax=Streptomyces sp. NPDC096354 TaxID=3366088 RepID=UPI0038247D51
MSAPWSGHGRSPNGHDEGEVSAVTPPGNAGAVDVVVNTTGGSATAAAGFTYVAGAGI